MTIIYPHVVIQRLFPSTSILLFKSLDELTSQMNWTPTRSGKLIKCPFILKISHIIVMVILYLINNLCIIKFEHMSFVLIKF